MKELNCNWININKDLCKLLKLYRRKKKYTSKDNKNFKEYYNSNRSSNRIVGYTKRKLEINIIMDKLII